MLRALGLLLGLTALLSTGCGSESAVASRDSAAKAKTLELLNVSYDPTRELWRDVNDKFIPQYQQETGVTLKISQSHGGSSSQARAVIDGLEADVVTLALWNDTNAIRKSGLIAEGWEKRLPNDSTPYYSTIVFVVRKGNPLQIHDWSDLISGEVKVITPSPKTSGNGKLSFLAAWGAVIARGGSDADALKYVTQLYQHTPVLDRARGRDDHLRAEEDRRRPPDLGERSRLGSERIGAESWR